MYNVNRLSRFLLVASLAALIPALAGCGGAAYREDPGTDPGSTPAATTGTTTTTTTTNSTTTTANPVTGEPPISFTFSITGTQGGGGQAISTPTFKTGVINTDNTLKVQITPGPAGPISSSSGSNYSATYYCAAFTVEVQDQNGNVIGSSTQTGALQVPNEPLASAQGSPCASSQQSQIIDFSGWVSQGHTAVNIVVTAPRTDMYCQWLEEGLIGGSYAEYCSSSLYPALAQDTVTGTLQVETDTAGGF
jgi:hypothetical protein